jgi:hypothetical protein
MLQLGTSPLLGNHGTFFVLLWGIGLFLQVMDEHVVFLYVKDRGRVDNWWQGKVIILIIQPLVVFERNV